jgi:hypothetical protein
VSSRPDVKFDQAHTHLSGNPENKEIDAVRSDQLKMAIAAGDLAIDPRS